MMAKKKFAFLLLSGTLLTNSYGQQVVSKPSRSQFDLSLFGKQSLSSTSLVVHNVRGSKLGLYALVSPGPVAKKAAILHTNTQGVLQSSVILPEEHEVIDFDADSRGRVYVLMARNSRTVNASSTNTIATYGPDGRLLAETEVPLATTRICWTGEKLSMLTVQGTVSQFRFADAAQSLLFALPPVSSPDVIALPQGRVAVLNKSEGVIHTAVLGSGSVSLLTPVIPGAAPPHRDGSFVHPHPHLSVPFSDIAAGPDDSIALLPGSYRLSEGAPIYLFSMSGTLTGSFRCNLPTLASQISKENPRGYIAPTYIATAGKQLVLVSGRGQVALYDYE